MSSTKAAIFLSIRDKSKRFPGKVRSQIKGISTTEHLIERLKASKLADLIVMTTSTHPDDNWLVEIAEKRSIKVFRGSEEDKLCRYLEAADYYDVDFCVIVDGDDLFCDAFFIDRIIEGYFLDKSDYIICDLLPLGVTGFGVKVGALRKIVETKTETNTEVWGDYFTKSSKFTCKFISVPERFRRPELRMTLDYPEDFTFFETVINKLYKPDQIFALDQIINLIEENPEIGEINKKAQKRYESNIQSSRILVTKDLSNF